MLETLELVKLHSEQEDKKAVESIHICSTYLCILTTFKSYFSESNDERDLRFHKPMRQKSKIPRSIALAASGGYVLANYPGIGHFKKKTGIGSV